VPSLTPNTLAITTSRTNPRSRENIVIEPVIPLARSNPVSFLELELVDFIGSNDDSCDGFSDITLLKLRCEAKAILHRALGL